MTDEEMAEEKGNEYISLQKQNVYARLQRKGYKDGFLAGLKAGRPQWHDLREDPADLPKRNGNVVQNQYGDKVTYDYSLKKWRFLDGETNGLKMIAWCEIPTFDKE